MEKTTPHLELIARYFSDFTPVQWQQLTALEGLYKEWNEKINVISRKDIDSLYQNHVLHSLSIAAVYPFRKGMQVLDIGTGGGFPGIPLAIFFPETQFHLADSIGKKIKVAQAVADAIGLNNITTQHTRVEDITQRKFDCIVSRAVAPLKTLWCWSRPLLYKKKYEPELGLADKELPIPNGLICLKGGDLSVEIADSGCRPRIVEVYELFPEDYFREKYVLYIPR